MFLLAHGWQSGLIGTVMTVGGVAGMLMTTPAGALVDATNRKKFYVIIPGICTVIASGIVLLSQEFWLVSASQVATAIVGAAIGPAVSGITLGMVKQAGFNRQNGHNQTMNHAGNVVGTALSGLCDEDCWTLNWRLDRQSYSSLRCPRVRRITPTDGRRRQAFCTPNDGCDQTLGALRS